MNETQDQTPNPTPPPIPDQAPAQTVDKQERNWAMFCHLAALAFIIPFGNIIAPLVIWLLKKEEYPLVEDQGKEAVNFQITMTICFIVGFLSIFVLIGFLVLPALVIFNIIMIIIATMKANEGKRYRYPFALRLIK